VRGRHGFKASDVQGSDTCLPAGQPLGDGETSVPVATERVNRMDGTIALVLCEMPDVVDKVFPADNSLLIVTRTGCLTTPTMAFGNEQMWSQWSLPLLKDG